MHLFHGSEHHVHVAYRKRTTACGFVRQIVLLGALQASLNTIIKRFFSFGSFGLLLILSLRLGKLRTLFCFVTHCDVSNGGKFKFYLCLNSEIFLFFLKHELHFYQLFLQSSE